MAFQTANDLGTITVSDQVLGTIAGLSAVSCAGVVGMASTSAAEGIAELLKIDNVTKGIKVLTQESNIQIELHIIVEYGVSMVAVADNVIDTVQFNVESMTGLRVNKVNVFIKGVRV